MYIYIYIYIYIHIIYIYIFGKTQHSGDTYIYSCTVYNGAVAVFKGHNSYVCYKLCYKSKLFDKNISLVCPI